MKLKQVFQNSINIIVKTRKKYRKKQLENSAYFFWESEGNREQREVDYWREFESKKKPCKNQAKKIRSPITNFLNYSCVYLKKHPVFTIFFGFDLISVFIIIILLIKPAKYNFEGQLLVKEMGFTLTQSKDKSENQSKDKSDQLLLANLRAIEKITLKGKTSLTLTGYFQVSDPRINKKLQQSKELTIELTNSEESKLTLSSDTKSLQLQELRLQENTEVNQLTYTPSVSVLSLQLGGEAKAPNLLQLNPDNQPLTLTISKFCLKDSPTSDCIENLKGTFETTQIKLPLEQNIKIEIYTADKPDFSGDINVKKVSFKKHNLVEKIDDKFLESSIVSGKIRMAAEEIEVKENQFLTIADPGIKSLRFIQIVQPKSEQDSIWGLEVVIAGQTNSIQVALNKKFPVTQMKISKLETIFPTYIISGWITFTTALLLALISWFLNDRTKSTSKNERSETTE